MAHEEYDEYDLAPDSAPAAPPRAGMYAPPPPPREETPPFFHVVRTDGRLLVVPRGTPLPDRCVRCNAPATASVRLSLAYAPPEHGLHMAGLIPGVGPLFHLIWGVRQLSRRDTDVLHAGLCARHRTLRRAGIAVAVLGLLVGGVLFYVGVKDGAQRVNATLAFAGVAALFAFTLSGWLLSRTLRLAGMDRQTIILRGAGRPFLDSLHDPTRIRGLRR